MGAGGDAGRIYTVGNRFGMVVGWCLYAVERDAGELFLGSCSNKCGNRLTLRGKTGMKRKIR